MTSDISAFEMEGTEDDGATGDTDNQGRPATWYKVTTALTSFHTLAEEMRPGIADLGLKATRLTAALATFYRDVRMDPLLDQAFHHEVQTNWKKHKDFFRAYLYWAVYEVLAPDWEQLRGFVDLMVAGLHIMARDFLFRPGVIVTTDSVEQAILNTTWGDNQRGLRACLAELKAMQRAQAEEMRKIKERKDELWRLDQQRERREQNKKQAQRLGMTLPQYEQHLLEEVKKRERAAMERLYRIVEAQLIKNGRPINTYKESLTRGLYFFDDATDRLIRVSQKDGEEMYACKIKGMTPAE